MNTKPISENQSMSSSSEEGHWNRKASETERALGFNDFKKIIINMSPFGFIMWEIEEQ